VRENYFRDPILDIDGTITCIEMYNKQFKLFTVIIAHAFGITLLVDTQNAGNCMPQGPVLLLGYHVSCGSYILALSVFSCFIAVTVKQERGCVSLFGNMRHCAERMKTLHRNVSPRVLALITYLGTLQSSGHIKS
jgi:hypothetical protein